MPKQLKIVSNSPNSSAPFTVNFATPIIVEPGNKITLDKFTATITSISNNFDLPTSSFILYYSLDSNSETQATITIPAGHYTNVNQLLRVMTQQSNQAFSGYNPQILPYGTLVPYYRDIGLQVTCTQSGQHFKMEYFTLPIVQLTLNPDNLAPNVEGYFEPTNNNNFAINAEGIMVQGGGMLAECQLIVPSQAEAAANGSNWRCGLLGYSGDFHGLYQNGSTGALYLESNSVLTQIDPDVFQDGAYTQFYQVDGNFALRTFVRDPTTKVEIDLYNSNTTNPNSLGTVDFFANYTFVFNGIVDSPTGVQPGINSFIYMTVQGQTSSGYSRTLGIDFTASGVLRAGLDIPAGLITLRPNSSPTGIYLNDGNVINMSIINSSFDIAVEILDIPLQTFQASDDGRPGARTNVLAYFHPEISSLGTSNYFYDSKAYQWLDIAISYPVNLTSLSFRVYNPETGINIKASTLSFNLMINDKEY